MEAPLLGRNARGGGDVGRAEVAAVCGDHPGCEQRFKDLERRVSDLEDDDFKGKLWEAIRSLERTVADLNGRITGYLIAGGLLGAVVGTLASVVVQLVLKR
jgi:hypothetical protein